MNAKLEFPCECHFRIIAENLDNMFFVVETVIMGLGIDSTLKKSNVSKKGKYISFGFSAIVDNKEKLELIDQELRNIKGVRMIL